MASIITIRHMDFHKFKSRQSPKKPNLTFKTWLAQDQVLALYSGSFENATNIWNDNKSKASNATKTRFQNTLIDLDYPM